MDWRLPEQTVLLKKQSTKTVKIELFPARLWPRKMQFGKKCEVPQVMVGAAVPDLYRLRIDGRWYRRNNKQYCFLCREDIFLLISRIKEDEK